MSSLESRIFQPPPAEAGKRRLRPWVVSLLLALAFLGFFILVARVIIAGKPQPEPAQRREPVFSVRAVPAVPQTLAPSVFLIGETEARDYAVLTAPLETEALDAPVREGDSVDRGDRLVILDLRDQDLQTQLQESDLRDIEVQIAALSINLQTNLEDIGVQLRAMEADRQSDQKRLTDMNRLLKLAEDELTRSRSLNESGVVAKTQVEETERALLSRRLDREAVQARVGKYETDQRLLEVRRRGLNEKYNSESERLRVRETQTRAQLEQTRLSVERAQVRAPFSGRVARVHASTGSRVARGAPLVEIFDPGSVRLRAAVPNQYLPALRGGGKTHARLQVNGESVTLTSFRIAPLTEPGRGAADVYFDLPAREWVLGATHEFAMDLPAAENAVALPFDALYSDSRIYKIDGESRARGLDCERVGVARQSGEALALLECPGLRPGDRVVATRLPNLVEGAKISVAGDVKGAKRGGAQKAVAAPGGGDAAASDSSDGDS